MESYVETISVPFDYVAVLKPRDLCSANELVKAVVCYLRKIQIARGLEKIFKLFDKVFLTRVSQ